MLKIDCLQTGSKKISNQHNIPGGRQAAAAAAVLEKNIALTSGSLGISTLSIHTPSGWGKRHSNRYYSVNGKRSGMKLILMTELLTNSYLT